MKRKVMVWFLARAYAHGAYLGIDSPILVRAFPHQDVRWRAEVVREATQREYQRSKRKTQRAQPHRSPRAQRKRAA